MQFKLLPKGQSQVPEYTFLSKFDTVEYAALTSLALLYCSQPLVASESRND